MTEKNQLHFAVIGAGMSGLLAAIKIRMAGQLFSQSNLDAGRLSLLAGLTFRFFR